MFKSYVYLITNAVTGQFYYGSRAGNIKKQLHPIDDLWKHYFTSSKYVKELIDEYGIESFEVSILSENLNYDDSYWQEQLLIKQHRKDPMNLNRTFIDPETGSRKLSVVGETVESKKARIAKMQKTKKGKFNSNGHLGLKHSKETKARMQKAQQELNYKHTLEDKKRMSEIAKKNRSSLTEEERKLKYDYSSGKTWRKVNGKRVWFNNEEDDV